MATYAVGLGCPFILSGVFGELLKFCSFRRNADRTKKNNWITIVDSQYFTCHWCIYFIFSGT